MRRKLLAVFLTLAVTAVSGCGESPESAVVREKTGLSAEKYQEEEDTETSLRERLNVPETCQTVITSEKGENSGNGKFEAVLDAAVEIPDVKKAAVYRAAPLSPNEELVTGIAEALFGDAQVYDGDLYFKKTKEETLEKLNELKAYQSVGNMDPYGCIAQYRNRGVSEEEVPSEEIYDIQKEIDALEKAYQEAPEEREKREIPLTVGTPLEGKDDGGEDTFFHGAAETEESVFDYSIQSIRDFGLYMSVEINRKSMEDPAAKRDWFLLGSEEGDKNARLTQEEAEVLAGITPEDAADAADIYMKKLGLTDFSAKNTRLSVCGTYAGGDEGKIRFCDAGYFVYYTRNVEGFPVTLESTYSSEVEDSDTTLQSWAYESVLLCINRSGLQSASILNLYDIGEKQIMNLKMLDFSEIMDIFEKMIQIRYASAEGLVSQKLTIDKVKLGYMRIYNPGSENKNGFLVPVWDFFGTMEYQRDEGGAFTIADPDMSWLTINAADGSVINRSYGY